MGFKEVTPVLKPAYVASAVKFSVASAKKNASFWASITVPLQVMVAADMNEGDRFKLLVGDGPDAGMLRVIKEQTGPLILTISTFARGARVARIKLGDFEGLPKAVVTSTAVKHAVLAQGLELTIPMMKAAEKPAFKSIMR